MSAVAVIVEATVDLTPDEARALTAEIRGVARDLVALVQRAYDGRAWIALDYPTWSEYLAAEVGTALRGIPVEDRREAVGAWADGGLSTRAIQAALGLKSDQTVRADLKVVRPEGRAAVVGLDGRAYAQKPAAGPRGFLADGQQARPLTKTQRAVADLDAAGEAGITGPELGKRRRWTHGIYSAVLSDLHRTGRIARLTESRSGMAVYCSLEHVAGRATEQPGRRPRRKA